MVIVMIKVVLQNKKRNLNQKVKVKQKINLKVIKLIKVVLQRKKKEKFEYGYDDSKNTGGKVDQGGVAKKKKEKFVPQSVGYDDIDQGDIAKKKKKNHIVLVMMMVNLAVTIMVKQMLQKMNKITRFYYFWFFRYKRKNSIDDNEDNYPLDYYLDEDEI